MCPCKWVAGGLRCEIYNDFSTKPKHQSHRILIALWCVTSTNPLAWAIFGKLFGGCRPGKDSVRDHNFLEQMKGCLRPRVPAARSWEFSQPSNRPDFKKHLKYLETFDSVQSLDKYVSCVIHGCFLLRLQAAAASQLQSQWTQSRQLRAKKVRFETSAKTRRSSYCNVALQSLLHDLKKTSDLHAA